MDKLISSRSNPLVQTVRKVRDGDDASLFFCEGEKLLDDLLKNRWPIGSLIVEEKKVASVRSTLQKSGQTHVPLTVVTTAVMKALSDLSTPPGVLALAKRPHGMTELADAKRTAILVLHGVQQPQNVGNVLRTSEASGIDEVWLTKNSADPFSSKALRGSMGSALRVPMRIQMNFEDALTKIKGMGLHSVAATQDGTVPYSEFDWTKPFGLILGAESKGLTNEELEQVETTISIPMKGKIESLNIGSAAAICMYEAARQRGF